VEGQKELRELSIKNLINIIEDETKRPIDIKNFIELCLFDMFIGNNDRHGRNLALIEKQGSKILCPFYDNPSYAGILESDMLGMQVNACGKIFTESTEEPLINDYVEEFNKLGYENIVKNFVDKLKKYNIDSAFAKIQISAKRKKAFKDMIENNRARINKG
jgi:hypothetical protein